MIWYSENHQIMGIIGFEDNGLQRESSDNRSTVSLPCLARGVVALVGRVAHRSRS